MISQRRTRRLARRHALPASLALAALALAVAVAPTAQAATQPRVKVMTRNLYLGADLVPALQAPDLGTLLLEAGAIWRDVQETNFPARATVLANEVADKRPDLIGLQEVALWRRGEPGVIDGSVTPATEVVYDFLDSLRHRLHQAGLSYKVVSRQKEADFELPLDFTDNATIDPAYEGRLTIRDVILAKRSLNTSNPQSEQYSQTLPVDLPPGATDLEVPRGWTSIDVVKGGEAFRFVNTHLEAFSSLVRVIQAAELSSFGGPLDTGKPRILVGDLNSDPDIPGGIDDTFPDQIAYQIFTSTGTPPAGSIHGFVDRGVAVDTCCHDDDLLDPDPGLFDLHLDHVLVKPAMTKINSSLTGDDPANRTPSGRWPSDHGGVVSTLRLP